MKTISTLFISLFALVATVNAGNVEITNISFNNATAGINETTVVVNWTAADNSNTRFEIERAFYSNNFTTIAAMDVRFTSNNKFRINDNDAALAGRQVAYYRIKQISANGTVSYSNTMLVTLNNPNNAIAATTSIAYSATENGNAVIKVKNSTGTIAATFNSISAKGNNNFELNTSNLGKGLYVAEISVNGVVTGTQKVIVD